MYATALSPSGVMTRLNLLQLPVWRLELVAQDTEIRICIRYISGSTTALAVLAAFSVVAGDGAASTIIAKGMPKGDRSGDKARMSEAMRILFNVDGMRAAQVDELIQQSLLVVDAYHDARKALALGSSASGELGGYRWYIHGDLACPSCADLSDREPKKEEAPDPGTSSDKPAEIFD